MHEAQCSPPEAELPLQTYYLVGKRPKMEFVIVRGRMQCDPDGRRK